MNLLPGDLAVIYRAMSEATGERGQISRLCIGRVVRVTHLRAPLGPDCTYSQVWNFEDVLRIDHQGKTFAIAGAADDILKPIRDLPGEDEVLRIAGKPTETPADVIRALEKAT